MNDTEVQSIAGPQRWETFLEATKLAHEIGVKCIIETGTWRGIAADGQSTLLLAKLAIELGSDFYSVDNNADHIEASKSKMRELGMFNVQHSLCDSTFFLSIFASPVQLLYLDSYDYSESNPEPAQLHQMSEIGAAWGKLRGSNIVLLDDCNIPGGGKGVMTTKWLIERGYKLHMSKYQNLLINF